MGEITGRNVEQPEWKNERDVSEDKAGKKPKEHSSIRNQRGTEQEEAPSPSTRRM